MGTLQPVSVTSSSDPASQKIRDAYVDYATRVHQQLGDASDVAAAKARTILAMKPNPSGAVADAAAGVRAGADLQPLTVDEAPALIPAIDLREMEMAAAVRLTLPERVQVKDPRAPGPAEVAGQPPGNGRADRLCWTVLALECRIPGPALVPVQPGPSAPARWLCHFVAAGTAGGGATLQLFHPLSQLYVQQ